MQNTNESLPRGQDAKNVDITDPNPLSTTNILATASLSTLLEEILRGFARLDPASSEQLQHKLYNHLHELPVTWDIIEAGTMHMVLAVTRYSNNARSNLAAKVGAGLDEAPRTQPEPHNHGGNSEQKLSQPLPAKATMAGLAINLVQGFRTGRANHWEFLRLWTDFELPSSCRNLPGYEKKRCQRVQLKHRHQGLAL
jgi:hypothetical protein